ncbi:2-oxoglutarate and iron-dependent oxygenase domain-containing protein 2-like isoform X2 [Rhopilema esculentum]|uniref:2-oxoglutarate and iron-dependent oxygenase domain-containing protein 2-like isoform X2 n=1 Tax=Rhopilema esculentum TaxID=499914 RepID=UPI0031D8AF0B
MAGLRGSYVCSCAFERNIFLKKLKLHVVFKDEEQFKRDYKEVYEEIDRRKASGPDSVKRKKIISESYKHLHPHLLRLKDEYLADDFLQMITLSKDRFATKEALLSKLVKEKAPLTYSFKVFTDSFCDQFLEEMENFIQSGLPIGKPNTMNNYGILLLEIGFKEYFFDPLVFNFLSPIAKILYPDWVGDGLDSHRPFIVGYQLGKDVDLSYHYDDAEITLNVSLGKEFNGGELYISGMKDELDWSSHCYKYEHRKTRGLLHRGQQMHGAMEIEDGERYNLVIWMRSSSVRNKCCPMCDRKPNLVEVEGEGAGFTVNNVDICCTL